MGRVIPSICVLLMALSWQQPPADANPILMAKAVFEFGVEAYDDYKKIRAFFDRPPTDDEQLSAKDVKMFDMLQGISLKLSDVQYNLMAKIAEDELDKVSKQVNKLWNRISDVQDVYNSFTELTHDHRNNSVYDVVTVATDRNGKLVKAVRAMNRILSSDKFQRETLLSMLSNEENANVMCLRGETMQRIIYDLFKIVFITDAQSLIVQTFGFETLEKWQNQTFHAEKAGVLKRFNKRIDETYIKVKKALAVASRALYKCEPKLHIKGKTYWKLQELFQAYFESEVGREDCSNTCPTIEGRVTCAPVVGNDLCRTVEYSREYKRCDGYLTDCKSIDSTMSVCPSFNGTERRYEWMETSAGKVYGQKQKCTGPPTRLTSTINKYPYIYNCEHCLCTCISDKVEADRYFSLAEVISDTSNNMIVTGVRLKLENHIFLIQIQQGRLQANGTIKPNTVDWQPISSVIKDLNLKDFSRVDSKQNVHFDGKGVLYPVDHTNNTIYLDDIDIPSELDEVVTGLRFQQARESLRLEVQRTAFDYATGTLKSGSKWHFNPEYEGKRRIVDLGQPIDPLLVKDNNKKSPPNSYVSFRMSDLEKDLGQTTVPFIDLQQIVPYPPSPLSGAGIFHRGGENSGGFVALKLFEYDRSRHM